VIFFQVDAVPIAQPRQRQAVKFSRKKNKHFAQNYLPGDDPVHAWKLQVQILARQAYQGDLLDGVPISLSVKFLMPRPVSKILPDDRSWHLTPPDTDNLVKAIKDALTGIIWKDDCLVCRELLTKEIAAAGEEPGAAVVIEVIA
jgi:Holliday junction resolvase RusA-like endonuclease